MNDCLPGRQVVWAAASQTGAARRLGGRDLQGHLAGKDRPDLLAGDVAELFRVTGLDREAVEDVGLLVTFDLGDRADGGAVGRNDVPTLLDLKPRNGICHRGHRSRGFLRFTPAGGGAMLGPEWEPTHYLGSPAPIRSKPRRRFPVAGARPPDPCPSRHTGRRVPAAVAILGFLGVRDLGLGEACSQRPPVTCSGRSASTGATAASSTSSRRTASAGAFTG